MYIHLIYKYTNTVKITYGQKHQNKTTTEGSLKKSSPAWNNPAVFHGNGSVRVCRKIHIVGYN